MLGEDVADTVTCLMGSLWNSKLFSVVFVGTGRTHSRGN
jgi:hypothetical protein